MTDSDLRELDGWIAEKFLGWRELDFRGVPVMGWEMADGKVMTWEPTNFGSFKPTSAPSAFALVKREIERRGWGWDCTRFARPSTPSTPYSFVIFIPSNPPYTKSINYSGRAASEELAGCLAVKAAVEGSDGN